MKIHSKFLMVLGAFMALLIFLIIFRHFSEKQMDDVTNQRYCSEKFLEKSDVLMIIPLRNNISIAEDKEWCVEMLARNKTLGMHGVFHTFGEFEADVDEDYILTGIVEFKRCFGYSPAIFEAPELKISSNNKKLLKSLNISFRAKTYDLFHKVYHCVDYEETSYLVNINKLVEIF